MKTSEIAQKLKNGGIRNPTITKYPWGMYWYETDENIAPADMREGHVGDDGVIKEWPWDEKNKRSLPHVNFDEN